MGYYDDQGNWVDDGSGGDGSDYWNQQFIDPNAAYNPFPGGGNDPYAQYGSYSNLGSGLNSYGGIDPNAGYYQPPAPPPGPDPYAQYGSNQYGAPNQGAYYPGDPYGAYGVDPNSGYPYGYTGYGQTGYGGPPDPSGGGYDPNAMYGNYSNLGNQGGYPYTGGGSTYGLNGQGYPNYQGAGGQVPGGYSSGGMPGSGQPGINVNVNTGTGQGNQYNPYVDSQLSSQARMYEADQQYRAAMAATQQRQQASDQSFQSTMAQISSQQQYYQGLLQNAQLDQQTRQYIADQSNALGMYQANLQSQYQQGLLGVQQGQLGLGYETLNQYQIPQMQGNLYNQGYANATQNLGTQGNLLLGAGNLALNAQQIQNQNNAQMGGLYLQGQLGAGQLGLGYGNLGVSQQQADTQRLQSLIAGYLGQGNLELGQRTLDQTVNQANQQLAMQRAQQAASLQGPRNAFAQQAYIHGLGANGVSNAVGAISGQRMEPRYQAAQAPVEAANLSNFSQDTGLPIPGVNGVQ